MLFRSAAIDAGVPVLRGIDRSITLEEAEEFFDSVEDGSGVMLKAVAGGGGRGSRAVVEKKDLERSFRRCKSEAKNAFGNDDIYVEEFIPRARHIEVQVVSDGKGGVAHLWDRECSVQRRFQKVVEIAPVPNLSDEIRKEIIDASVSLARHVGYSNIGTFEFLVRVSESGEAGSFAFIETNARLQVEHTVTEVVTGVDVVQTEIAVGEGPIGDYLVTRYDRHRENQRTEYIVFDLVFENKPAIMCCEWFGVEFQCVILCP